MALVRLVKHEVKQATQNLISAEAELAGMKVRYEWEQKNVNEQLKMGNQYSDRVKYSESQRSLYKQELDRWNGIHDFVVETFINNN